MLLHLNLISPKITTLKSTSKPSKSDVKVHLTQRLADNPLTTVSGDEAPPNTRCQDPRRKTVSPGQLPLSITLDFTSFLGRRLTREATPSVSAIGSLSS